MDEHCRICAREIAQGQFDVLLGNSCMYLAVSSIARHVDLPSVLYLQEPNRFLYEAHPQLPWLAFELPGVPYFSTRYVKGALQDAVKVQGYRRQAREEVTNAAAYTTILVNSYYSRESVLRAYGLDANVCYLGVDTDLFTWRNLARENFVIGLGSVTPAKNIRFILESLAHVPDPVRPSLVWVGNMSLPYYEAELLKSAESRGVKLEIRVAIDDSELVDLLNRAMVMVYAPRLEPFGFAPLEASACGLPVVAVAEGGVRETMEHEVNSLLVENSPQAMADAVQLLLSDRARARQLGRAGAQIVRDKWTLEQATSRLESRLADTIAKARRLT